MFELMQSVLLIFIEIMCCKIFFETFGKVRYKGWINVMQYTLLLGSMCLVALALSSVTGGMNLRHPMVGLASIALSMALFALSFLASLHVHRNKEF